MFSRNGSVNTGFWICAIAVMLSSSGTARGQETWSRTLRGFAPAESVSSRATSDGGFVTVGSTSQWGMGGTDIWVVRTNPAGGAIWQKAYGGAADDVGTAIRQTRDGGYIVTGWTSSFGAGGKDVWVLRLDASGNVLWERAVGGVGTEEGRGVAEASSGNFVVAASTDTFGAGAEDLLVLRFDPAGNLLPFSRTHGGAGSDIPVTMERDTYLDSLWVLGSTTSYGAGGSDFWLLEISEDGFLYSQRTYGGPGSEIPVSVHPTPQGGLDLLGSTTSFGAGLEDAWVVRLNGSLAVVSQQAYGGSGSDVANDIADTPDGLQVLAGESSSFGDLKNAWLLKLRATGAPDWQKHYRVGSNERIDRVESRGADGLAVAASIGRPVPGSGGLWLMRLDSTGGIDESCPFIDEASGIATPTAGTTSQPTDTQGYPTPTVVSTNAGVTATDAVKTEECHGCLPDRYDRSKAPESCRGTNPFLLDGASQPHNFCDDDADWMTFNACAGRRYTIETDGLGPNADTVLELFDTDCRTLLRRDNDGGGGRASRIVWTAPGYGSYHVRVSQFDETRGPDRGYEVRVIGDTSACTTWAEGPASSDPQGIRSMEQVSDGGFLAIGAVLGTTGQPKTDFLMRLDVAGHPLWRKKYGAPGVATILSAREDLAGGIVITGYLQGTAPGLWVAKLDREGEPEWQKTYAAGVSGLVVRPMAGGGYGVLSIGPGFWVMRLDASGNVLWARRQAEFLGTSLDQTEDEGFIVSGWRTAPGLPERVAAIFKLDSEGNLQWVREVGAYPEFRQYAKSVRRTLDGGYVVAGYTWDWWSTGGGNTGDWVLKLDPAGEREWSTFFVGYGGGESSSWTALQTPDGGYAVSDPRRPFWLARLDASGNVLWAHNYDRAGVDEYGYHLGATADGGFALAGGVYGTGTTSFWLVRTDDAGLVHEPCPYVLDVPHGTGPDEAWSWRSSSTMDPVTPSVQPASALAVPLAGPLVQQCGPLPPDEVSPLGAARPLLFVEPRDLVWEGLAESGSDSFNLYRGDLAGLPSSDYGSCLVHTLFSPTASDASTPGDGGCWTYLVTGRNAAGEGTMGFISAGVERPNAAPCP